MKILVVGSKGFIGSHCVNFFRNENTAWGCDVYTDYNESEFFLIDSSNSDFQSIFIQNKFDFCINCSGAASVPESMRDPARDYVLNVYNVFQLLESIRKHNASCKFINLSSAAVYGNPVSLPVSEAHQLLPLSPYGFHKLQAEQLCLEYHRYFGLGTCSLRIFSAYGPGLRKQILWDLFLKSRDSNVVELFGTGDESRDFIFIDDIMSAINAIVKEGAFDASIYNLSSGESQSIRRVSEIFLTSISWRGTLSFTGIRRPGDPDFWQADISKIKSIGFVPTITIEDGIKKYTKWVSSLG